MCLCICVSICVRLLLEVDSDGNKIFPQSDFWPHGLLVDPGVACKAHVQDWQSFGRVGSSVPDPALSHCQRIQQTLAETGLGCSGTVRLRVIWDPVRMGSLIASTLEGFDGVGRAGRVGQALAQSGDCQGVPGLAGLHWIIWASSACIHFRPACPLLLL